MSGMFNAACTCSAGYGERHAHDCGVRREKADWTLTIERADGRIGGRYDFANEGAARAGASSYITQTWVGSVRVAPKKLGD